MKSKTVAQYNAGLPMPVRIVFSKLIYDHGNSLTIFATVKSPDWQKDLWKDGAKAVGGGKNLEYHQLIRWQLIQRFWRHLGAA